MNLQSLRQHPNVVETEGQALDEAGEPMIDLQALIKAAEEQSPAPVELEPKRAIHRLENETVKAGKLIFDAVASEDGADRLVNAILGGIFK